MPADVRQSAPVDLAVKEPAAVQVSMASAECDHAAEEAEDIVAFFHERPIEPVDLVILAIGVVVPALCASDLVAGHKHRNALVAHENICKVFNLPLAQGLNFGTLLLPP